jgi:hypothetical protein
VYESSEGTEAEPALETWEVIRQEGNSFVVQIQQPFVTIGGLEEQFVVTSEGVQRRLPDATPSEPQLQLILKLPPAVSTSWQGANGHYTITAVDATVTVPAGTFSHCVEVTRFRKETKVTEIITYAPGVGMIQRDATFTVIGGFGDFETCSEASVLVCGVENHTSPAPKNSEKLRCRTDEELSVGLQAEESHIHSLAERDSSPPLRCGCSEIKCPSVFIPLAAQASARSA